MKINGAYYHTGVTTISLKLPKHLLARLEKETQTRHTTKSALVRDCLERGLDTPVSAGESSCYDLARDLAGSIKGLPKDLAVNPKYLEGFGQ
ncbi:MAG: ribbon-helix-helix domain-containing protein [Verrucomicrobiota bacterium]